MKQLLRFTILLTTGFALGCQDSSSSSSTSSSSGDGGGESAQSENIPLFPAEIERMKNDPTARLSSIGPPNWQKIPLADVPQISAGVDYKISVTPLPKSDMAKNNNLYAFQFRYEGTGDPSPASVCVFTSNAEGEQLYITNGLLTQAEKSGTYLFSFYPPSGSQGRAFVSEKSPESVDQLESMSNIAEFVFD